MHKLSGFFFSAIIISYLFRAVVKKNSLGTSVQQATPPIVEKKETVFDLLKIKIKTQR